MPDTEPTPYSARAWNVSEDETVEPNSSTRIAPSKYERQIKDALAFHTGSPETYLTVEQEQALACAIQDGLAAQSQRDAIENEIAAAPSLTPALRKRYDQIRQQIRAGKAAEVKLIECNLRLSHYLALASMNILPPGDENAPENSKAGRRRRALLNNSLPWLPRDFTSLKSRFAVLDDRIQQANEGLIRAARTFKPGMRSKKGELVSFMGFAAPIIKTDLARYVRGGRPNSHEKPIHIPADVTDQIVHAHADDWADEFTPERREELLGYELLNDSVVLEELYFHGAADEEIEDDDADPTLLSAAEVIPTEDPEDAQSQWFAEQRRDLIHEALETLSEREAGVIRLRFGLVDGQTRNLDEVGMVYGVTRERIRQIESKALDKLRHPSRSRTFSDLIETDETGAQPMRSGDIVKIERSLGRSSVRLVVVPITNGKVQEFTPRESWQAYPDEAWDDPVRMSPAEVREMHQNIVSRLKDTLFSASLYTFQKSFTEEVRSAYPKVLADRITEEFGRELGVDHLAKFWNSHLTEFIDHLQQSLGDDASPDRAVQLLSKLMAERMDDSDVVELRIPNKLRGTLGYVGAWLSHGTLRIKGDVGSHAGYEMQSLGHLQIDGNVGDFAGARLAGNARLEIDGDAGDFMGDAMSGRASILVNGNVGRYCGHRMRGRGNLIEILGEAGEHIGYNATQGEIIVGGRILRAQP